MGMRQLKITKSITNRESQSLEKYLQEIGKVDLLKAEEEVDLAKKIEKGEKIIFESIRKIGITIIEFYNILEKISVDPIDLEKPVVTIRSDSREYSAEKKSV